MSKISIEQVKELRAKTGVSIMQCKKALEEANGDLEKAKIVLTKKSGEIAAKKGDRELGAGFIATYTHNGVYGTMIELACETDFVSNNEEFKVFARDIAMHITAQNPKYLKEENIDSAEKEKAMEVLKKEVQDKPENMQEKILEGKMKAYFKERVLLSQSFIKNPDKTIADLISEGIQKFGERIEIIRFVRYGVGEL